MEFNVLVKKSRDYLNFPYFVEGTIQSSVVIYLDET